MRNLLLLVPVLFLSTAVLPAGEKCPITGESGDRRRVPRGERQGGPLLLRQVPRGIQEEDDPEGRGAQDLPDLGRQKATKTSSLIDMQGRGRRLLLRDCPKAFVKKNGFEVKDAGPAKCPISGGAAKKVEGSSRIVNGETIYFCCANCPKKYEQQLGVVDKAVTEKAIGKCPVSGAPEGGDAPDPRHVPDRVLLLRRVQGQVHCEELQGRGRDHAAACREEG